MSFEISLNEWWVLDMSISFVVGIGVVLRGPKIIYSLALIDFYVEFEG